MAIPLGLVVDDDPHVRRFLAEVFRRKGFRTVEAQSGREALGLATRHPPDFVVTDIEMPDVNGLELCRQLRQLPSTSKVPIVVVTGAAETQGDAAVAAGCDVVLPKPCPPALLVATIHRLLFRQTDVLNRQ